MSGERRSYAHVVSDWDAVDRIAAETRFSGVVRVDRGGDVDFCMAYGLAHRGWHISNTTDTRFAIASGTKGLTALTVASLIEEGRLELATTARSVLGMDLPLIDDAVTVEQLLAHRSGIGDYVDEETAHDIGDILLPLPANEFATTEQYLPALDGHPRKFPPGERFSYSNSGYVVLALIAERASGTPFSELVRQRVCVPAGMPDTEFLRTDEPAGRTVLGYVDDGLRTNVFHVPVRGNGDGGIFSTAADIHALWTALFAGRIVPPHRVADMVRSRSDVPRHSRRYGLGFWLRETGDTVLLEGYDHGVSFQTVHDPSGRFTFTVLSNTTEGAWPIARHLNQVLMPS
jgi:CubicO group peptidase (beta-lactamase class C family)